MEGECRKIQEDEKLVILSVYEREAKIEGNAWKVWKPLVVTIHLEPVESASRAAKATVCVDLTVTCSAKYPNEPPTLSFTNVKGISSDAVGVLQQKLVEKAKGLIGNAMILDLCTEVREFLYENTTSVHGSFHDNMVKKIEQEKNERQRQRVNSERREVEQIVEERERYNQEAQVRRGEEDRPKPFLEDAPIRVIGGRTIAVKSSNITKRQRPHACCNEWVGVFQNEELLVSEWVFKYTLGRPTGSKKKTPVFDEFLKKLDEVESFIKRFPTLVGLDQTVVPCLFCEVDRRSTTPQNINVHVTIGQKIMASEQSLSSIMNSVKHEPNVCRRLAGHAICALRWLHEEGLAHGAVSTNSFWVSDSSFRLSDAGTLSALLSLCDVFNQSISGNVPTEKGEEKITRKKDLFALGTMIDGIRLNQCSSSSTQSHPDDELTKFIHACQSAKSVEELLNLPYLKIDLAGSGSGDSRFGSWQVDENCRLFNEFILMKMLGRGGFGEVILARNKVDDSNYAIKRIPLYAKSEKLNRRITREAKLFAKLNHPNVVRYYSAWIENTQRLKEQAEAAGKKPSPQSKRPKSAATVEDSLLPTRLRNLVAWLEVTQANGRRVINDRRKSPALRRHQAAMILLCPLRRSSPRVTEATTNSISSLRTHRIRKRLLNHHKHQVHLRRLRRHRFRQRRRRTASRRLRTLRMHPLLHQTPNIQDPSPPSRLLFIQMEFCGHSTLRCFIDNRGLFGNPKVIWRMFREMLSGLSYIHRQGMIHRDIKPMNILLDEEDRVKIGDFGLATRDFFRKMDAGGGATEMASKTSGQTRDIGTELYMAPELFNEEDSTPYTSKIDVYSSGIVLFEMFYQPIPPGMQRVVTMKSIKKLVFPEDFGQGYNTVQKDGARQLITWMLAEQADCRPTVDELLADDRISEDVDAQSVQALLQKSVKRGTRNHTSLMKSLFKEEMTAGQNYCFDMLQCQEKEKTRPDRNIEFIRETIREVVRTHSFEPLYTHTLLPAVCVKHESRQKPVTFLDSMGFPVSLPMDLRQNFVRYCCRNAVFRMKRYTFDRVYRSNDNIGFNHPSEKWECSLDCIAPLSAATTMSSELLDVACELSLATLPGVRFTLRIGHMGLVIAALRHLTVPEDMTQRILQKLHDISTAAKTHSLADKTEILAEVVGSRIAASLLSYLPTDTSFIVFKECCKTLVRSRDDVAREAARNALNDIDKVSQILHSVLDLPTPQMHVTFDASLVYRPSTFRDGLVFLVATDLQSKKGPSRAVVIGGGRYDSSLARERHPKDPQPPEPLCLVGCSVSLEMFNSIRRFMKMESPSTCSALICSYTEEYTTEKFILARRLWNKSVSTDILHDPVDHSQPLLEYCESRGIVHLLVVFGRDEVLVMSEGIDHGKMDFDSAVGLLSNESDDEHEVFSIVTTPVTATNRPTITPTHTAACATFSNCNVNFAIPERMMFSVKKRVENQVRNVLPEAVALFSARGNIEIVVTELSKDLVKNIAGAMSRHTTTEEMSALFDGLARQYGKSKQDLESLFTCLKQICSPRREAIPVIILFRHQDGFYKTIT